jgi:glycosyltransferase involved in cell wall biosynthesis
VKILYISPWFPYPPVNGSKQRIYHLIRSLAQAHEIELISFVRPGELVDVQGMAEMCSAVVCVEWNEYNPRSLKSTLGYFSRKPRWLVDTYSREMAATVSQQIALSQPETVICGELPGALYAPHPPGPRVIQDDIEVISYRDEWLHGRTHLDRLRRKLTWGKLVRFLGAQMEDFSAATVVSAHEYAIVRLLLPMQVQLEVIPNGVDLAELRHDNTAPERDSLIFNGALTFHANYQAMSYFLKEVFPLLQAQRPGVKLTITGSAAGIDLGTEFTRQGVMLSGYLDDIRPAIRQAWACVAPILQGSGTRIKILEAMALGTPVVTTSKGIEGLAVRDGEHVLVADQPLEFAEKTARLLENPELRRHLVLNARKLVELRYDWVQIGDRFRQMIENSGRKG